MDKVSLLKKLEEIIDEIARTRSWASVEIEFRDGVPNMVRTSRNEKLTAQENHRARFETR